MDRLIFGQLVTRNEEASQGNISMDVCPYNIGGLDPLKKKKTS